MIVFPMAGLSRRFTDAGYAVPKYRLPLPGGSLFAHAVRSFRSQFGSEAFLFVAQPIQDAEAFLHSECAALGIAKPQVVMLDRPTAGQAETVLLGLRGVGAAPSTPLTIFNIDTIRLPSDQSPVLPADSSGYLEVFRGSGANWSYVEPAADADRRVVRTAEKCEISDLCCTGLYHFARADDFMFALDKEMHARTEKELYVAPLYNHLISRGQAIHYKITPKSDIVFCGVPQEYEAARTDQRLK